VILDAYHHFDYPEAMLSHIRDSLLSDGKLVIVGASAEPFSVGSLQLIPKRKSIMGWPSGTSKDSEDALGFAAANGIRPMIETFALERAAEGYERMLSGKVRFRAVLKM
jgi:D-arabinose 1-dehydrogenase-like Zn-dependent alcohol dehydrogenase